MESNSIPDWISAIASAVTALVAIYLGAITFRQQRTSNDVQLALSIFSEINRYWDRITDNGSNNYDYHMGQVLTKFETAATLFNKHALADTAQSILKDHIIEVFCAIKASPDGDNLIATCRSSPDTFKELRKFLRHYLPVASPLLD